MPYSRRPRRPLRRRRIIRRRRTVARPNYRRRRVVRRPYLNRRRLLNITSVKKQDTMQSWSNIETPGTFVLGGATYSGGTGAVFQTVWCPTARPAESYTGITGSPLQKQIRQNSNCFMRGVKESIMANTNSGITWKWRRICFTMKGDTVNQGNPDPDTSSVFRQTSNGMMRLWTQEAGTIGAVNAVVFKGQNGTDWSDHFAAKTDSTQVTVKFDKTFIISSGNSQGVVRKMKLWHPMNKTLIYEDDENGDVMTPSPFSVESKAGMGDYYIYDIVEPNGGTSEDTLVLDSQATLYWHER